MPGPAFVRVRDGTAQPTVKVEYGTLTWLDGEIDLAPEYVYDNSIVYNEAPDDFLVG